MLQARIVTIALFIFFSIATAFGQLGPKDGANLKPTDLERIKAGDKVPDFALENMDGERISLADFAGKKNVVLVFYRGHW